jgi:hypothetical protein
MNVGVVQQHFRELTNFVQMAGASTKVVEELSLIAGGLEHFKDRPLGLFVEFLKKAEEYDRTGVLPVVASKPKREPKPKAPPKPLKPKAAEIIQRVVTLYQNILTPTLTNESIEQELALVDSLKGTDLQSLATQLDVAEKVKKLKVKEKIAAIKQVVRDRRGMFERADF